MEEEGRALCGRHCAGRGLGHHGHLRWAGLEAEETPPWWGPALPHIVGEGVTGRVCMQLVPNILHTRLAGPLHHQRSGGSKEADSSGSSVFPAIPVPGLGLRRQTGVGKGAGGAGRGQRAGVGGRSLPGKPLLPPRSPGLKSKFGASRAGAPWPGPSPSRPQAQESRGGCGTGPGGADETRGSRPLDPHAPGHGRTHGLRPAIPRISPGVSRAGSGAGGG